jgi:hypothetical protein
MLLALRVPSFLTADMECVLAIEHMVLTEKTVAQPFASFF